MDLKNKFEEALKQQSFSVVEIMGFMSDYKLALLAGMTIGYIIAINTLQKASHETFTSKQGDENYENR